MNNTIKTNRVAVIGSGFSSIAAASYLAKKGFEVDVYEKNNHLGGRAAQFEKDGFKFDMGPTWYWMPDVFESYFKDFGRKVSEFYTLEQLSPGYRVFFGKDDSVDIEDSLEKIYQKFESIEQGSAEKLKIFIEKSAKNYEVAIKNLVYKPGISFTELITPQTVTEIKQFISTIHDYVSKNFKNHRLRQILEFPVLFLGAKPSDTPLFYSFMNYADFGLGTWYPKGGMYSVVKGMVALAEELGVVFHTNSPVEKIITDDQQTVKSLIINGVEKEYNFIVSGADYHHTEQLLPQELKSYSETYWQKRTMAPSALLYFVGIDKKLQGLLHHTLFFDQSFDLHAEEIYDRPQWPTKPLFYASFPSITDSDIAPEGKEAAIFLIPIAPDLEDTPETREKYFELLINRLESLTNQEIKSHILFQKSYCVNDFKADYNSFRGNAYGMANTLFQTAFLRPKIINKKVKNLFHTGQLTVPGPGVPPSLISGKIVADQLIKFI
jgi:phytoene desaturase